MSRGQFAMALRWLVGGSVGAAIGGGVGLLVGAVLVLWPTRPAGWEQPHSELALYDAALVLAGLSAACGALGGTVGAAIRPRVRRWVTAVAIAFGAYVSAALGALHAAGFFDGP